MTNTIVVKSIQEHLTLDVVDVRTYITFKLKQPTIVGDTAQIGGLLLAKNKDGLYVGKAGDGMVLRLDEWGSVCETYIMQLSVPLQVRSDLIKGNMDVDALADVFDDLLVQLNSHIDHLINTMGESIDLVSRSHYNSYDLRCYFIDEVIN